MHGTRLTSGADLMPMTTSLLAPTPWTRIHALAAKTKGLVAVPFIGKGGAALLPLKRGSILVTRIDEVTVRQGGVDPAEVAKLIRRGVKVHLCSNLHAKVYVFGKRAIVGSANASKSSMGLMEAGIETNDESVVAAARAFVLGLCVDEVGIERAKSLLTLYPGDRTGFGAALASRTRAAAAQHSPVWICPVHEGEWTEDVVSIHRRVGASMLKRLTDPIRARLDPIDLKDSGWKKLKPGDRVVQRWAQGRGFEFEPPSRIIDLAPYGGGALLYLERPKRLRMVSSADMRASIGSAGMANLTYRTSSIRAVRSSALAGAIARQWPSLPPA